MRESVILGVLLLSICFCSMIAARGNDPLGPLSATPQPASAQAPASTPDDNATHADDVVDIYVATIRQLVTNNDLHFVAVDGPYLPAVMRRLADLKNCRPITASTARHSHERLKAVIADRATGKSGVLVYADAIQWKSSTQVTVPCGLDICYARGGALEHCDLIKRNGRWVVVSRTIDAIP